ncbi:MAG: hypothetical protein LAP85_03160 [Acidobacteriia bacterium]|nr:hypothetical protein [Terriglobia bacterium]
MMQEKVLTNILLKSGERDVSRGAEYVRSAFNRYGVRSYAVLVDHTSVAEDLPALSDCSMAGFYTFELNVVGTVFAGDRVKPVTLDGPIPACDGWLVASTSRAAVIVLNHALMNTGNENRVITRLYGGQISAINAYMDVFSGETETVVQISHYYERKYRITFPIDVRYTICACDGTVRAAGQRIIPPGGLTVIDTRELNLGEFAGYLRLELEVENLQTRVQPFIHFWADYISKAGLTRNHQSGWDQWAPNSVFARGYYPVEPELELTLSFYNENDRETHPRILLHYNKDGEEIVVEKAADPVPARHMSYQNISRLFRDISLEGVKSAFYLIRCDTPLHRPNYYMAPKGTRQYINTSHQTGSDACHWAVPADTYNSDYLQKLDEAGVDPWVIAFPLLEERFKIDTYLGLLSSTIARINDFTFIFRNERGEVVFTRDETLDGTSPEFLNLNEYAHRHGVALKSGLFGLAPRKGLPEVPRRAISLLGFKHKNYKYIGTAPAAGFEDPNLPFYIDPPVPLQQQYDYCPVLTTDRFGPGMVSDEYDTLYLITNCSLYRKYARECTYRLEVFDARGKMHCVYRTILPQSYDVFWLSEILAGSRIGSDNPYYTVWQRSYDTLLISYHFLYRKRDHAMSCDDTFGGTLLIEPQVWDVTGNGEFARPVLRGKNLISAKR